jgi:MSHA biogenesis protein MshQ
VTITAHTATHTVVATTDTILLGTSTGHGDWTLTTGSGTFTAGASNSGAATYTYSSADAGSAVFALRDTYAETVTINVTDGSVTATSGQAMASEDAPLIFKASGFIITNGSNVATAIGTQVAGVTSTQSLALQAVRTDTNTGACTAVFASGATVNVGLAYQCNNPASCVSGQTFKLTNNGTTTALASSSYTTVALKFSTANAEAPFTLVYSDAGQISLDAKYTIPLGNGSSSGNTMLGAAQFVVQPYTLKLSNIMRTSNSFANPAASTATGTVFMPAGQAFSATVTAYSSPGTAVTPNFGQETTPATVTLTPTLVLPTSGDDPAVSGSFILPYSAGAATGSSFTWPEVGIISLTPSVTNYLGSGAVTGTTTGNVGRFIPNNFLVSQNTPLFATACTAGKFTYLGQPFIYSVAPVITVTAQSLGGTTTLNYTGSLFRLTNASLTARTYTPTPASPTLTTTGLPATTSDPTIVSSGNGVGTLTFSAGTGLLFTRGTPIAPLSANIALSINVIDLDSVAATTNPVTFGASSGIQFTTTGNTQYYGRLALRDALGSELLDLPMSLTTQYYVNSTSGFTANTADSCTPAPAIAFTNYLLNLTHACVQDTGSPGVSGAGCTAAGAVAERYDAQAIAGGLNLWLAAPGSGDNGAVTVTATAPTWLQYLWSASPGINSSPSANATFGVFPGPPARIYQREVY